MENNLRDGAQIGRLVIYVERYDQVSEKAGPLNTWRGLKLMQLVERLSWSDSIW